MDYEKINLEYRRIISTAVGAIRNYVHGCEDDMYMNSSGEKVIAGPIMKKVNDILELPSILPDLPEYISPGMLAHYNACLQLEHIIWSLRFKKGEEDDSLPSSQPMMTTWKLAVQSLQKADYILPNPAA